MINETGKVATLCGVYDGVVVNAEHVAAADAFFLITLLPHVCDHLKIIDHYMLQAEWLWTKRKHSLAY